MPEVNRERESDPAFDRQVEVAMCGILGELQRSAMMRATYGYVEPVYYEGVVVGHRRKYSDGLTVKMLEAWLPDRYAKDQVSEDVAPDDYVRKMREAKAAMDDKIKQPQDEPGRQH